MNKRGMQDYLFFLIWQLIAFGMVALVVIMAVRGVVNNNNYWKNYYSRDVGMIVDIENINQGDFAINYMINDFEDSFWTKISFLDKQAYEVGLEKDRVQVYDYPTAPNSFPTSFPFAKHRRVDVSLDKTSSNFFVISKTADTLRLSNYIIEDADTCPGFDTTMQAHMVKLDSFFVDAAVKPQSDSLKSLLTSMRYGGHKDAVKGATVILGKADSLTIYYSSDSTTLASQKLACEFRKRFSEKYSREATLVRYDGSLDKNPEFIKYDAARTQQEFWIIIMLGKEDMKIPASEFAILTEEVVKDYYGIETI